MSLPALLLSSAVALGVTPEALRIPMEEGLRLHALLVAEGAELLAPHSFAVELPLEGSAWFVSTQVTDEHQLPMVAYRVLDAEGATLQILVPSESWSSFEGVSAVAFRDMSGDGLADVTTITSWTTGIGPQGALPFHSACVFVFEPETGRYRAAPELLLAASPIHTSSIDRVQAYIEGRRAEAAARVEEPEE